MIERERLHPDGLPVLDLPGCARWEAEGVRIDKQHRYLEERAREAEAREAELERERQALSVDLEFAQQDAKIARAARENETAAAQRWHDQALEAEARVAELEREIAWVRRCPIDDDETPIEIRNHLASKPPEGWTP